MIGDRIKEQRIKIGMSQEKLGKILSISQQAVGKWEKNLAEPDSSTLSQLCDIFSVTLDYLLGRTDVPNQNNIELNNKQENKVTLIGRGGRYFSYNISEQDIELVKQFLEKFDQGN